jgi:hypothetical protein
MDDNKTLTANFEVVEDGPFALTVSTEPTGGGSVVPDKFPTDGKYEKNTAVKLTATAGTGYTFIGWVVGVDTVSREVTYTVTMDSDKAITAVFKGSAPPDTYYTIDYAADPAGSGSVTPVKTCTDGKCKPGDEVVLQAAPADRYKFSYWEVDGVNSGSENPITIVMTGDKSVKAKFVADDLKKLISIESAEYIDSAMQFSVTLVLEEALNNYYTYELKLGSDTVAFTPQPVRISGNAGATVNFKTPMIEDVQFNSTYTVYVRIVNESGTQEFSNPEYDNIEVGDFKVQKVTGVGSSGSSAERNVAYADNDRFRLDAERWKSNSSLSGRVVNVEVRALDIDSVENFISVSKVYKYEMEASGSVIPSTFNVPFVIGIEVDTSRLPSGFGAAAAKLYRYVNNRWEVLFDSDTATFDGSLYVTGEGRRPVSDDKGVAYRLMINTKTPVVKIGASATLFGKDSLDRTQGYFSSLAVSAIDASTEKIIVEGVNVSTNVANTRANIMFTAVGVGIDNRFDSVAVSTDGNKHDIDVPVKDIVRGASGVLMYLIVNNGTVSDTVNMSRNITLRNYTTASRDYDKAWSPLYSMVHLKDSTIEKVFGDKFADPEDEVPAVDLSDDEKQKRYRLSRFVGTGADGADRNGWVEYGPDTRKYFNMVNGRLMWLRTRPLGGKNSFIFETQATTTVLTDTFSFRDTLKAGQWTDLVLPFDFKVRVRDVLAATVGAEKSDSLYFCTWKQNTDGKNRDFRSQWLYVWSTGDANQSFDGPFSVYNATRRPIVLRVPPKPAFLSEPAKLGKQKNPLAKESAGSGFWYYAIDAAVGDVPDLASLRLGYYESERIAPAPPTLGSRSVVLLSDEGGHVGYYLTPELSKSGRTFKLRFINGDRQKATFKFSAAASAGVPERMQLMFIDAVTGEVLGGSGSERSITVAGSSHSDVYAVMGSRDYLNKTAVGPSGAKFAMGGLAVNQAARSVRIKYYVPLAGTDRVEVSVYNLKGRTVWKNTEKVRQSSWNTMEWRAGESRGGATSAGLYIIRVRAINVNGKTTAVENRRITFSR